MGLREQLHHEHIERQRRFWRTWHTPKVEEIKPLGLEQLCRQAAEFEVQIEERHNMPTIQRPKAHAVMRIVARHYGIECADMIAQRRTKAMVHARQVGMYLAYKFARKSTTEIGRVFGDRDHTTVLHALNKISLLRCSDEPLADELDLLTKKICDATGWTEQEAGA